MDEMHSDVAAALEYAKANAAPHTLEHKPLCPFDGQVEMQHVVINNDQQLIDLTPKIQRLAPCPDRPRGTATMNTPEALAAWMLRQKTDSSALFVDGLASPPVMVALSRYSAVAASEDNGGTGAEWGDYRAQLTVKFSKEWQAWTGKDGAVMPHADFAAFMEDRIIDVASPPEAPADDATDAAKAAFNNLTKLAGLLGGQNATWAEAAKLMDVARQLQITDGGIADSKVDTFTGSFSLMFQNDVKTNVPVPRIFLIAIPVFEAGRAYRIPVKLRIRKDGGVKLGYNIHRPDLYLRDAWNDAVKLVTDATGIPAFDGKPEAVWNP